MKLTKLKLIDNPKAHTLENTLEENGLQQDSWTLTKPVFGKDNQLEVIGWTGITKVEGKSKHRYYVVRCNLCAADPELYGDGIFKSVRYSLTKGCIPCGCSATAKRSQHEWEVLASRKSKEKGFTYLGFVGEFHGGHTKASVECHKHGIWNTTVLMSLVNCETGCPSCGTEKATKASSKTEELISSFLSSGSFHEDTKFWRSDRQTTQGTKVYWFVSCPLCGETGESLSESLKNGYMPCGCARTRQKECYINIVLDKNSILAVKFGIANNSKSRLKKQNHSSTYRLVNHIVYSFPNVTSCKAAERECLFTLDCKVLTKEELWDGYTETTSVMNINKITDIYEKHGGVLICPRN